MFYYPERILLLGFILYGVIYLIAPLEPQVDVFPSSVLFIGTCCLAFTLGSRFDNIFSLRLPWQITNPHALAQMEYRLFMTTFVLGAFGNFIRLFDKYILRGVGSLTGFEAREVLIESSASSISLIGASLYPFGYIPIFIYLGSRAMPLTRRMFVLSLGLFLIPALDALILFSRSFMLVSLAMIYFGSSLTLFQGNALPRKLILPILVAFSIVLSLSIALFSWRLSAMNLNIVDSIFYSGYGYTIAPNQFAQSLFETNHPASTLLAALLPIAQYFTHSLFEFQILWAGAIDQSHSYGALHFAPYMKVLALLGLGSQPDLFLLFPRVGIFTSFFGPLWVDFGWFSPFVMFAFGMLCRRLGRRAQLGDIGAYPLYTQFCVILLFAPIVNFVISSQGMYSLSAFTLFWLFSRRLSSIRSTSNSP